MLPKKRPPGTRYCSAINCSNARGKNPGLSFFKFPKDPERCRVWVKFCRRQDLQKKNSTELNKSYQLCATHFENPQFMNSNLKIKLIHNAIPTIFNVPKAPRRLECKEPSPRKREGSCTTLTSSKKIKVADVMCGHVDTPYSCVNLTTGSPFESHRKVVEILCFDGQQYRYIYRGNETVCNIKLECADGVELFVSLEDLDELEPATLKTSRNKLPDLNASDVTNDASPKDGVPIPKPVLSELNVKEDSPLSFLSTTFVSQGSNSDDGTVEDDSNVLLELCTQTGTYERKEVKSLCQENNRVYSCDKSKLTLKKKGKLQSHRGVNSREHPFKCYRCSKTFKTKVYYERHVKTHSDKSSFLCSDCGKSFSRNNQMKDHQSRVHHKGTHSKCDICAKGFTTARDLKHHLQTVHNEKTFGCKERWTHDSTNS